MTIDDNKLVGRSVGWLVGWLFNGTSTQKGQFVPTAGEGNWLSRLSMANEIQETIDTTVPLPDDNK